jgi:hypothetical protein
MRPKTRIQKTQRYQDNNKSEVRHGADNAMLVLLLLLLLLLLQLL